MEASEAFERLLDKVLIVNAELATERERRQAAEVKLAATPLSTYTPAPAPSARCAPRPAAAPASTKLPASAASVREPRNPAVVPKSVKLPAAAVTNRP